MASSKDLSSELVQMTKNFRAMTHDETKYPSPDEFKPERFLRKDGSLITETPLGFGWGRRMW
jgi:cytochrome P450